jgi:hypothetical protein
MAITRRQALLAGASAAALAPLRSLASAAQAPGGKAARPRISLAVSTYSYWHFKPESTRSRR